MDLLKNIYSSDSENDDTKPIVEPPSTKDSITTTRPGSAKKTAEEVDLDNQSMDMSMSDDEESNGSSLGKDAISSKKKSAEKDQSSLKSTKETSTSESKEVFRDEQSGNRSHYSSKCSSDRPRGDYTEKMDRKREHDHRDKNYERDDRDSKTSKRYDKDSSRYDRSRHGHRSGKDNRNAYKDSRRRDDRDYRHEKDYRRKDDYSDRRDRRYKDDRDSDRRSSYQKQGDNSYSDSRRPSSKDSKHQFRKRTPSRSRSKTPPLASKAAGQATITAAVTEPLLPQRSPPSTSNNLNVAITNNPRMERIRNMKLERLEKLGIDISAQFGQQIQAAVQPPSLLSIDTSAAAPTGNTNPSTALNNGITLPAYYNPAVINPTKYADQVQKRKLLWSGKKAEPVEATKWGNTKFSQDTEGKVASKFMRLMGIKNPPVAGAQEKPETISTASTSGPRTSGGGTDVIKTQEELFSTMEQQYEVARQVTHTMRGVGLGFGTSRPF